jgi:xanthine dehydrogenase YagS FAD-binding subunit
MINFEYIRTSSAKAAVDAKAKNASAQFIAGGTNLVDLMKKGVTTPEKLIDINGLPLKLIVEDATHQIKISIACQSIKCRGFSTIKKYGNHWWQHDAAYPLFLFL